MSLDALRLIPTFIRHLILQQYRLREIARAQANIIASLIYHLEENKIPIPDGMTERWTAMTELFEQFDKADAKLNEDLARTAPGGDGA